jgi:hypothetical protein
MQPAESYPNLARWAKSALLAEKIQKAKEPLMWLWGVVFVAMVYCLLAQEWILSCILFALSFVVQFFADKRRRKAKNFHSLLEREMEQLVLPRIIDDRMKKGNLHLPAPAAESIERCAKMVREIQANYVQHRVIYRAQGKIPNDIESVELALSKGSDVLMKAALKSLQRPLMTKVDPSADELADLAKIEADIGTLFREADHMRQLVKRPALDAESQEALERAKAIIELRNDPRTIE